MKNKNLNEKTSSQGAKYQERKTPNHIQVNTNRAIAKDVPTNPGRGLTHRPEHIESRQVSSSEAETIAAILREKTHEKILLRLVRIYGVSLAVSLVASYILIAVAITNPQADKDFLMKVIPAILGIQGGVLGTAYAVYCGRFQPKKAEKKEANRRTSRSSTR